MDDRLPLVEGRSPGHGRRPSPGFDEVGSLDEQQEAVELLPGVGVEADVAVGSGFDRRRLQRSGGSSALRPAAQAVHEIGGDRRRRVGDFGHREVDQLTGTAVAHLPRRGERGHCAVQAAHPFEGATPRLNRRPVAPAADRQRPALRLQRQLGRGPRGIRALEPERRDRHHHQRREARRERSGVDEVAAGVDERDVRPGEQLAQRRPTRRRRSTGGRGGGSGRGPRPEPRGRGCSTTAGADHLRASPP